MPFRTGRRTPRLRQTTFYASPVLGDRLYVLKRDDHVKSIMLYLIYGIPRSASAGAVHLSALMNGAMFS